MGVGHPVSYVAWTLLSRIELSKAWPMNWILENFYVIQRSTLGRRKMVMHKTGSKRIQYQKSKENKSKFFFFTFFF